MRQLLAVPFLVAALAFVACQQSQEGDDDARAAHCHREGNVVEEPPRSGRPT